jgi:hypothetical protein
MTPPDPMPPDVAGDSRRPDEVGGSTDRRHAAVSGRSSHDDDLFYFVDKVGGHAACHAVVRYSANDPVTAQSTAAVRHVWVIPRSTDFVAIVMTGPASGEDSSDSIFQRIISDVRIH